MGGISQDDLERALDSDDLARLEAVPGLGKKTAQKMLLSLKGKLLFDGGNSVAPSNDLVQALVEMGYDKKAAAEALARSEQTLPAGMDPAEREG
jgi:Holliday junction DNA helicase RuvA